MSNKLILSQNEHTGTTVYYTKDEVTGNMLIETEYAEEDDVYEDNEAFLETSDDKFASGRFHRCASIPAGLRKEWEDEIGGEDIFNDCHADFLKSKLNDPEYSKLRVKRGRM